MNLGIRMWFFNQRRICRCVCQGCDVMRCDEDFVRGGFGECGWKGAMLGMGCVKCGWKRHCGWDLIVVLELGVNDNCDVHLIKVDRVMMRVLNLVRGV